VCARTQIHHPTREILQRAREYPILGCWIMEGWQENGITPIVIARQQPNDRVLFAVCLVDLHCLGVKDAYKICSGAPQSCSVELAHEIVYGALEFAERYGFGPHPDFKRQYADQVLDPPEAHPRIGKVKFGREGKPLFVSGPYDDERKSRQVIAILERTAGTGNYDYLISFGDPDSADLGLFEE
jgi:hypothetical protein